MPVARMFSLTRCKLPCYFIKSTLHTSSAASAKVAVVLSGCGVYDGSEIHEASAVLVHLSRNCAEASIFAPNLSQMHTIDHQKGVPMEPNRNVLVESARIARGPVEDLSKLSARDFDAIIFPGGFGAAKNLSSFGVDGANMKVNTEVEHVLKDFHCARKPIGLICIAPVLAAKVFPGCEVTVGSDTEDGGKWPNAEAAVAIQCMKSYHIKKDVTECHVDYSNKIVSTPAFMCNTAIHNVFDGIGVLVRLVLKLTKGAEA